VLDQGGVRARFVANACPPEEIAAMERFAERHADRVVEVVVASTDRMVRHGDCLDLVLARCDDSDHVGLLDPDILARGPWIDLFLDHLGRGAAAVTSGREVWSETNVRPADHPGVNGEYFYDVDGFVYGSPHLAVYAAAPLRETMARWGVGFSSAGNDLTPAAEQRLRDAGRALWIYDTGKIVNILLQLDGHVLVHEESDALVHIGGLPHYMAPPSSVEGAEAGWGEGADWGAKPGMSARFAVAAHTASTLRALERGEAPPAPPEGTDPSVAARMRLAAGAVVDLVAAYGSGPEGHRRASA
jgi:hypothetical protein